MKKLAIILSLAVLVVSCKMASREPQSFKKTIEAMSTYVTITVVAKKEKAASSAISAAFTEISRLEGLLSFWDEDSEISRINQNAGIAPVKVSKETIELAERAIAIATRTDGAFDPTIGPVVSLWDFQAAKVPTKDEVASSLKLVDYKKVVIDKTAGTIYLLDKGMTFDTGGIAKGYATDRAVEVLKANGITSGLVAIAGDIRAFGTKPDGLPWQVGIRDPRSNDPESLMGTVELSDEAISTSGDYERYFILDGKRYHHIINPKTGFPSGGVMSASVVAKTSVDADGYSTAVFVMGHRMGMRTARLNGFEAMVVDLRGNSVRSSGLVNRVKIEKRPAASRRAAQGGPQSRQAGPPTR